MNEYRIAEYNQTAAALAELQSRYGRLFDVTTSKGMEEARKARAEIKGYRVALEKLRQEIKAPALERSRLIDEEARRITAELLAIEEPIDQQIKAEETRKAEERAAKARVEVARVAAIAARIAAIRNRIGTVANQPAAMMSAALEQLHALELAPEEFEEFMPDARVALVETRAALESLLDERIGYEAEQARLKAEQEETQARLKAEWEELERLRKAEADRQAEQARMVEAARQVEAARLKSEREQQEAELKAQREKQERQEQEACQARQAEEARLKAEREEQVRKDEDIRQQQAAEAARIAAAKAELDERQRLIEEREAKAKAEAEAKEKAAKAKSRSKAKADPLADLKQAASAGTLTTLDAIDQAYQLGFNAGLQAAQQAA